ncbi:TCP-1/cpn60 chaperonin family protein [Aneurinibacillus sp. Ricciae_BoGa-3]|uniref:TCP-1/cpn60 chaperonin family protein n=1 Tax=Aneurinibacillus sp. Ricciae_BoGa-3 TaxID=3022697 RepID=UPI0023404144|nr:TCP-1/cpn60 chaperonin family protein [Aneurinibacillus sp. Ricciae_BoGa-3]WCK53494.1 TCP-1/cpn60 chaperonin family protein [Aneurinibacillus sp. Ricciae_BoGa-3]
MGENKTGEERLSTLLHNVNAVQAVASSVEGTIGPKGLDTMLVDENGNVIITNDGVTILEEMEVKHPAARMVINIARAQQDKVGDGTTTATLLAAALVSEGASQVSRGVPVAKVISGIRQGITKAVGILEKTAVRITSMDDEKLYHISLIAGREHEDIAHLIMEGAKLIGEAKMLENDFRFSDLVTAKEGADNEVIHGVLMNQRPLSKEMPEQIEDVKLLVLGDALAPEEVDDEALGTERGFQRYLDLKEGYTCNLQKLVALGINTVVVEKSCDSIAEEFCIDNGIMVLHRVSKADRQRVADHTGARTLKRTGLNKSVDELTRYIGRAKRVEFEETLGQVRIMHGAGKPTATMLIGASTEEVVGERERIAKDAASAMQACIRAGYLPGGGSIEIYLSHQIEQWRTSLKGMEGFGVEAVANALRKPLSQMVQNAGFNPLEKVEMVKAAQVESGTNSVGMDFDTGRCADMLQAGVVDPALVKIHALKTAGEVSQAILRIHTIIRMKSEEE